MRALLSLHLPRCIASAWSISCSCVSLTSKGVVWGLAKPLDELIDSAFVRTSCKLHAVMRLICWFFHMVLLAWSFMAFSSSSNRLSLKVSMLIRGPRSLASSWSLKWPLTLSAMSVFRGEQASCSRGSTVSSSTALGYTVSSLVKNESLISVVFSRFFKICVIPLFLCRENGPCGNRFKHFFSYNIHIL